jgi:FHA domain
MTEGREAARRPARAPLRQRSRKRWAIAGGTAACWVLLAVVTGSVVSATVLLVIIAGLGAVTVGGLRALGVTMDHPWLRRAASRPWRDGQDVLKVAMRHLSDVFVVTPNGALLAPNVVELQLNPDDLASLCERMELGVIGSSMTEVYQEQVAEYRARLARPGPVDVYVVAARAVPPGRYRLRQADRVGAVAAPAVPDVPEVPDIQWAEAAPELAYAAPQAAGAGSGTCAWHAPDPDPEPDPAAGAGLATIMEWSLPRIPVLRLITGSSVAETKMSGARAGRGPVELVLPDVPTVSREHARFTYSGDRWWITNQGRNGLTLNDVSVAGEQPLSDGDEIRWGTRPDALLSRVEIG